MCIITIVYVTHCSDDPVWGEVTRCDTGTRYPVYTWSVITLPPVIWLFCFLFSQDCELLLLSSRASITHHFHSYIMICDDWWDICYFYVNSSTTWIQLSRINKKLYLTTIMEDKFNRIFYLVMLHFKLKMFTKYTLGGVHVYISDNFDSQWYQHSKLEFKSPQPSFMWLWLL